MSRGTVGWGFPKRSMTEMYMGLIHNYQFDYRLHYYIFPGSGHMLRISDERHDNIEWVKRKLARFKRYIRRHANNGSI